MNVSLWQSGVLEKGAFLCGTYFSNMLRPNFFDLGKEDKNVRRYARKTVRKNVRRFPTVVLQPVYKLKETARISTSVPAVLDKDA